jgi:hypothetical protein
MDTDNTERRTRTSTTWRASRHMGWVVHDLDWLAGLETKGYSEEGKTNFKVPTGLQGWVPVVKGSLSKARKEAKKDAGGESCGRAASAEDLRGTGVRVEHSTRLAWDPPCSTHKSPIPGLVIATELTNTASGIGRNSRRL